MKVVAESKVTTETKTITFDAKDIECLVKEKIRENKDLNRFSFVDYTEEISQNCLEGVVVILKKEERHDA